jgi:hypothetical protein
VLLAAVSLWADTPPVDEIISRYAIARGGYEKLQAIRTIIYRGVYREGAHQSDHAAMSLMRPFYKLVGDAEHLSSDFAEGYDGGAWEFYGDPASCAPSERHRRRAVTRPRSTDHSLITRGEAPL